MTATEADTRLATLCPELDHDRRMRLAEALPLDDVAEISRSAHYRMDAADVYLLEVAGDEDAAQVVAVVGDDPGIASVILHMDSAAFPLPDEVGESLPGGVAQSLAEQWLSASGADAADVPRQAWTLRLGEPTGGELSAAQFRAAPLSDPSEIARALHDVAVASVDRLSSKRAPTGPRVACVWALNEVFRAAVGRPLTGTYATVVLARELRRGKGRRVEVSGARPGHIVISPTKPGHTGHVGVVGRDGKIYSNSSRAGMWKQNFTLESWRAYYVGRKGLAMDCYELTPFPPEGGAGRAVSTQAAGGAVADAELPSGAAALRAIDSFWAERDAAVVVQMSARPPISLLAEGDSWFDFPLHPDVIDCLERHHGYAVANVARAGACIHEMAYGPRDLKWFDDPERDPTQLEEVVRLIASRRPRALLLSGAGNDFAGPQFILLVMHAAAAAPGINLDVVDAVLRNEIEPAYVRILETAQLAARRAGINLPILVHGYAHAYPDGRRAFGLPFGIANIGPWMDGPLAAKGYPNRNEGELAARHEIVRILIDKLYGMLDGLAARYDGVHVVDARPVLSDRRDWHDELHPTKDGFRRVAKCFDDVLKRVV